MIAHCGSRKFETDVLSNNGGKLRKAKILLCAKPGDSDAAMGRNARQGRIADCSFAPLSAEAKSKVAGDSGAIVQVRIPNSAQPPAQAGHDCGRFSPRPAQPSPQVGTTGRNGAAAAAASIRATGRGAARGRHQAQDYRLVHLGRRFRRPR